MKAITPSNVYEILKPFSWPCWDDIIAPNKAAPMIWPKLVLMDNNP